MCVFLLQGFGRKGGKNRQKEEVDLERTDVALHHKKAFLKRGFPFSAFLKK